MSDKLDATPGANAPAPNRPKRTGLGCSIALFLLLVILVVGVVLVTPRLLDAFFRPAGMVTVQSSGGVAAAQLAEHRAEEMEQLTSYGWVSEEDGVLHIPIERAMVLTAEDGLPVGTDSTDGTADGSTPESASGTAANPPADLAGVNFQDHVLPIFEAHCAECHGDDDPEEGLVLTSYDDVMLGSFYGSVITPGDPDGSYLVELVVTGQMPKRGDDLSQAEIDTIVAWVQNGAPPTAADVPDSAPAAAQAVGPETVSFQEHVLPVFEAHCAECHGDEDPEEGLVLTSYDDVMLGSFYGSVIEPGDPDGSYLVEQVVTGQMPKRGDDLSQAEIDAIIAWVEAGAPDN